MLSMTDTLQQPAAAGPAHAAACGCTPGPSAASGGSRRRRIWELAPHAHCPVIGVCLPIAAVRQIVNKVLAGQTQADDYELHCGVNAECKQRNRLSEAVQKALDHRYAQALRQGKLHKTTESLGAWWVTQSRSGGAVAGALWAVLTHPRCDATLEDRVLHDMHMLQHQNGAADRADLARLNALLHENQVLTRELGAAQRRCTQQAAEQARKLDDTQAALMRARADLMGRDTVIASLWEKLRALEAAVPDLRSRDELSRQLARQTERIQDLDRALLRAQQALEREHQRHREALVAAQLPMPVSDRTPRVAVAEAASPQGRALADQSVLCVGGRQASVPAYRQLIEQVGGRFLHHDGGEENNAARLDSTLAAADLVICQTGCISHDAYWRVKDHCKRTGKRCVFVDNPSNASLRRALAGLAPAEALHHSPPAEARTPMPSPGADAGPV